MHPQTFDSSPALVPDLRGRVVVVTGEEPGAGRAIAIVLGEAGATVYVTGRSRRGVSTTENLPGTIDEDSRSARGGWAPASPCAATTPSKPTSLRCFGGLAPSTDGSTCWSTTPGVATSSTTARAFVAPFAAADRPALGGYVRGGRADALSGQPFCGRPDGAAAQRADREHGCVGIRRVPRQFVLRRRQVGDCPAGRRHGARAAPAWRRGARPGAGIHAHRAGHGGTCGRSVRSRADRVARLSGPGDRRGRRQTPTS